MGGIALGLILLRILKNVGVDGEIVIVGIVIVDETVEEIVIEQKKETK